MLKLIRRFKWTGPYYDQSKMPVVKQAPKNLKWLWKMPDPPAYPKTLASKLDDGSTFHQLLRRKPLYEYADPATMPEEVVEKTLPPIVHDRIHGPYQPRELSKQEVVTITERLQENGGRLMQLAVEFKCSREQIRFIQKSNSPPELGSQSKYGRTRPEWSWWFKKKYAKAQPAGSSNADGIDYRKLMPNE